MKKIRRKCERRRMKICSRGPADGRLSLSFYFQAIEGRSFRIPFVGSIPDLCFIDLTDLFCGKLIHGNGLPVNDRSVLIFIIVC